MKKCTIITDGRGRVECPEEQYSDALINAMGSYPIIDQWSASRGGFYYWRVPTIADTPIHCLSVENEEERRLYITLHKWQYDVARYVAEGMIGYEDSPQIEQKLKWIEQVRGKNNV